MAIPQQKLESWIIECVSIIFHPLKLTDRIRKHVPKFLINAFKWQKVHGRKAISTISKNDLLKNGIISCTIQYSTIQSK